MKTCTFYGTPFSWAEDKGSEEHSFFISFVFFFLVRNSRDSALSILAARVVCVCSARPPNDVWNLRLRGKQCSKQHAATRSEFQGIV